MRRHSGKRSRPKAEIEPIRVGELLAGAGMRGFLSVLESPVAVPHLRELASRAPFHAGPELVAWLSARTEALLKRMGDQREVLASVAQLARRMNGSAERLTRVAERIRLRTIDDAARLSACHEKGESFMKKIAATRAHRSAPQAGWQEWISEKPSARTVSETSVAEISPTFANRPMVHEEIARLAYAHWLERGCPTGSPEVDWFHAEQQLLDQMTS